MKPDKSKVLFKNFYEEGHTLKLVRFLIGSEIKITAKYHS